jgi:hypothetical protein
VSRDRHHRDEHRTPSTVSGVIRPKSHYNRRYSPNLIRGGCRSLSHTCRRSLFTLWGVPLPDREVRMAIGTNLRSGLDPDGLRIIHPDAEVEVFSNGGHPTVSSVLRARLDFVTVAEERSVVRHQGTHPRFRAFCDPLRRPKAARPTGRTPTTPHRISGVLHTPYFRRRPIVECL